MGKPGLEYEELVARVSKALDPNAEIKTSQWVEGPDGSREVDVEVRGTVSGVEHFILIECKDWRRPVDIQELDKLDSKRNDLNADFAMIYSNSGFSKKALRKAERLGIDAVSAIATGSQLVSFSLERELVAKALSVDSWSVALYPSPRSTRPPREPWNPRTLRYEGLPVVNWLQQLSVDLLSKYQGKPTIAESVAFRAETPFVLEGTTIWLRGMRVCMTCSRKWLSQVAREDASLAVYSHITRRMMVPNKQLWSWGCVDENAWQEIEIDPGTERWTRSVGLSYGELQLNMTKIRPIAGIDGEDAPPIDDLIGDRQTDFH